MCNVIDTFFSLPSVIIPPKAQTGRVATPGGQGTAISPARKGVFLGEERWGSVPMRSWNSLSMDDAATTYYICGLCPRPPIITSSFVGMNR